MKKIFICLSSLVILGACAQKSNEIAASYVSPLSYQSLSCPQLHEEAQRVSRRLQSSMTNQDEMANDDAAATAVTLILFWPAVFFINGDDENSAELGRLKGEMDAIEQANIQRNCNIQFQ